MYISLYILWYICRWINIYQCTCARNVFLYLWWLLKAALKFACWAIVGQDAQARSGQLSLFVWRPTGLLVEAIKKGGSHIDRMTHSCSNTHEHWDEKVYKRYVGKIAQKVHWRLKGDRKSATKMHWRVVVGFLQGTARFPSAITVGTVVQVK